MSDWWDWGTVIQGYLIAGLLYGLYAAFYYRKQTRDQVNKLFRDNPSARFSKNSVVYVSNASLILVSVVAWPWVLLVNAGRDYRDAKEEGKDRG